MTLYFNFSYLYFPSQFCLSTGACTYVYVGCIAETTSQFGDSRLSQLGAATLIPTFYTYFLYSNVATPTPHSGTGEQKCEKKKKKKRKQEGIRNYTEGRKPRNRCERRRRKPRVRQEPECPMGGDHASGRKHRKPRVWPETTHPTGTQASPAVPSVCLPPHAENPRTPCLPTRASRGRNPSVSASLCTPPLPTLHAAETGHPPFPTLPAVQPNFTGSERWQ